MTLNECAEYLLRRDNYLLLTHARPDGDTLGSASALCAGLRTLGKTAFLYGNPQITETHEYYVRRFIAPTGFLPKIVVTIDTATETQFPKGFDGAVDLCIDHHASNSGYTANSYVDASKSACGEIILELLRELERQSGREQTIITTDTATALYIAVSTDTGCFCYANTTAETHRAAAELIALGADIISVNKRFFRTSTAARLKLEGMVYSSLKNYLGGRVNVVVITNRMIAEAGALESDCEDLAGLAGRAEGSEVSVTIRETPSGHTRVSMRSSPNINVSDICQKFGGGGHAMAAGCNLNVPPSEAEPLVVGAVLDAYGQ